MNVLLVVKNKVMETLGPMYLSAVVKQTGHDCKIVTIDEAPMMAKIWKPEIIGYSIMTGDQFRFKVLNAGLKDHFKFTSLAGNCHPTFFPEDCDWADSIIGGEAEQVIAKLLGSDIKYPELDSIPWPDRTDFPNMKIRDFISSRGCPYDCSYCFNDRWANLIDSPRVRTRSAKDVIKEMVSVAPSFAYFQDSCFGVSTKWLHEFAHFSAHIPFHCHLRPVQVTNERVSLLAEAGCASVRIALETASDKLRKLIGRPKTSNEETFQAARVLRKWGIPLMIQNMLGLPTSTIEEDLQTLEVNIYAHPAYGWCSIFSPYPGTKLGDLCKQKGWYAGDYSEMSDSFFDGSLLNFTDEHKEQLDVLQKVFALCVEARYLPDKKELTKENFPKLVHKIMRTVCDKRLYGGVI